MTWDPNREAADQPQASQSPATAATHPCSATGMPVTRLAEMMLPRRVAEGIAERAAVGQAKYGAELCASWPPATREAWQEILDALAYLLASGNQDDALFAVRLGNHVDAWARVRGIYTGLQDG